jgi:hypothetical protein
MLQVKLENPTPDDSAQISLSPELSCLVDKATLPILSAYQWHPCRWNYRWYAVSYASETGMTRCIAMHRLIAKTPPGEVCHHLNGKSLDNRLANLLNMTNRHHAALHGIRHWGRKKKVKPSEKRQ